MANIETITVGDTTFDVATTPANMEYSTTEKQVGTWIDGKPVYQCVAVATNITPTTSWRTIATLPANIKQIIKYDFILCNPSASLALGENADGEKWECYTKFDYSNNILQISVDTSYSNPHNFIIIYQYTKTTD